MKRIVKPNQTALTAEQRENLYSGRGFDDKKFSLHHYLFDKQLEFVTDPSPFRVAVCSRRSGKTVACAAHLIDVALKNPGVLCLYITLTIGTAKRIIQPVLEQLNRDYKLGMTYNITDSSYEFKNKSKIYLAGAANRSEIEKFRGISKLKICYIDECQSFPTYIGELIDDVIAPALIDLGGELNLIGTPGPVPSGFFHDCAHSGNWAHHGWTFWDNPHIEGKQKKFERELARRGIEKDAPSIRREWFGEWVLDTDSLLITYSENINDFKELPPDDYTYILGIDVGFNDADALAVLGWGIRSPNVYLVEEIINPNQDITALMTQIQSLRTKYNIAKCVIDTGGLGKKIAEELVRRHAIPLQPADKARKMENVKLLNDYLKSGRFKARDNSIFAKDSYKVEIDWANSTPDRLKVSSRYHSDIIDAVLYAFKECYGYTWSPEKPKPKWGTKEWYEEQEDEMYNQAYEMAVNEERSKNHWEDEF